MKSVINQIKEKGFVKFNEPEGLDLIKIDQYKLLNTEERSRDNGEKDISEELNRKLQVFAYYLKTKYIDAYWQEAVFNKFLIWDGVDKDNQGWHTDIFEGYDLFLLYYFDDTFSETGGSINFKWKNNQTESFQPKKGDLFLVNNTRGFWHRADSTIITRRVASFDFNTKTGI